jgi:hypothetical protein
MQKARSSMTALCSRTAQWTSGIGGTEMGGDPPEQFIDIIKQVAADRTMQCAEIRINSRAVRRGKTGNIENNIMADIVEVAEDSPLGLSQSIASRRSNLIRQSASHAAVHFPRSSSSSSFSPIRGRDPIGEGEMHVVEDT